MDRPRPGRLHGVSFCLHRVEFIRFPKNELQRDNEDSKITIFTGFKEDSYLACKKGGDG